MWTRATTQILERSKYRPVRHVSQQETSEMERYNNNGRHPSNSEPHSALLKNDASGTPGAGSDTGSDPPSRQWIKGVHICAAGASVVLFINIILFITATILAHSNLRGSVFTTAIIYEGSCSVPKHWEIGPHFVINILNTVVLAASNYCMQLLSAPTRKDVDRAHSRHTWLEIGIPGLRNISATSTRQLILWLLLMITSAPIHLM